MVRPSQAVSVILLAISLSASCLLIAARHSLACDFCELGSNPFGGVGPNTYWRLVDSLAVCPAGDSVLIGDVNAHHPSKLRIEVWYDDANCNPKVGA
jgi:hypothetical protein